MKSSRLRAVIFLSLFLIPVYSIAESARDYSRSSFDYRGVVPVEFDTDGRDELVVDFGSTGLYFYHATNKTWTKISGLDVKYALRGDFNGDGKDELVVDFGTGVGLYIYQHGGIPAWIKINALSTKHLCTFDFDAVAGNEILCDFGASYGIYVYKPIGNTWTKLSSLTADVLLAEEFNDLVPHEEIVADFGNVGVYGYDSVNGWEKQLSGNPFNYLISGNFDMWSDLEVLLDFGGLTGLYKLDLVDFPTVLKISSLSPGLNNMTKVNFTLPAGFYEEAAVYFPTAGFYLYDSDVTPNWTKLTTLAPDYFVGVDLDDGDEELVADFGAGTGFYVYSSDNGNRFQTGWTKLSTLRAYFALRAELFPTPGGYSEMVVDFGAGIGLYIYYYDSVADKWTWRRINTISPSFPG